MLKCTFLHIPGVGYKTERRFWNRRIYSWNDFFESYNKVDISQKVAARISRWLVASEKALKKGDISFFAKKLPKREWWRLYPELKEQMAFLDIETTGLSFYYDDITMIGIFDGDRVKTFIQGQNLDDFKSEIKKYSLLVTYNGALFDLRFIRDKLGQKFIPPFHIDLRFLLKRLGYTGGLKNVETRLGINRNEEISDISGFDATVLWNRYVRGDDYALKLLAKYNTADIVNLKALLEFSCLRLRNSLLENVGEHHFDFNVPKINVDIQRKDDSLLELRINGSKPILINPEINRIKLIIIDDLLPYVSKKKRYPRVVGIDLSGSEKRNTGWALLEGKHIQTDLLKTDEEIIETTAKANPDLISIDSPLSLPRGRDCTKDSCKCRRFGIFRKAERTLRSRGVYVFPSLIRSMQSLTERGIRMRKEFERRGFSVIESYPGAAQDILRIIRKKVSLEDLKQGLKNVGLIGEFVNKKNSHDELDAITSALVGYFYLSGKYEALGSQDEGYLIIPKIDKKLGFSSHLEFSALL